MKKQCSVLMLSGFLLAGCAPYAAAPQQSMFNPNTQALAAAQPNVVAPTQALQQSQSALDKVSEVDERVRRVERAMIRLDRRMQIIERNELSRLSGGAPVAGGQPTLQPTSYPLVGGDAFPESTIAPQFTPGANSVRGLMSTDGGSLGTPSVTGSYMSSDVQPVSYSDGGVVGVGTPGSGIPSLADTKDQPSVTNLAIWTVSYEDNKIWPTRDQLAASRDVVDNLRSGGQVTVFARGARPSSKVFRERVRAISRYLGRVAGSDSIPIASMPAENMPEETIEVMVTR